MSGGHMDKPFILVTNDDGIYAPGIAALRDAMAELGTVFLIAPAFEQSAVGHSITLSEPLRMQEVHKEGVLFGHSVNGAPADCVKLAVFNLLDRKPDLLASGINLGENAGINALYSGTVAAAIEGAICGIPSLAISLEVGDIPDFTYAAHIAKKIAQQVLSSNLPDRLVLNVNIPSRPREQIRGVKTTRMCIAPYNERYECRKDPRGRTYYWLDGEIPSGLEQHDTDLVALRDGYVSVTPLHYDLTDHALTANLTFSM